MYYIKECDMGFYRVIGTNNKPIDPYLFDHKLVKYFKTRKAAADWIRKHTYAGMSFHYEIFGKPEGGSKYV